MKKIWPHLCAQSVYKHYSSSFWILKTLCANGNGHHSQHETQNENIIFCLTIVVGGNNISKDVYKVSPSLLLLFHTVYAKFFEDFCYECFFAELSLRVIISLSLRIIITCPKRDI